MLSGGATLKFEVECLDIKDAGAASSATGPDPNMNIFAQMDTGTLLQKVPFVSFLE